jgi:hypothetical protein
MLITLPTNGLQVECTLSNHRTMTPLLLSDVNRDVFREFVAVPENVEYLLRKRDLPVVPSPLVLQVDQSNIDSGLVAVLSDHAAREVFLGQSVYNRDVARLLESGADATWDPRVDHLTVSDDDRSEFFPDASLTRLHVHEGLVSGGPRPIRAASYRNRHLVAPGDYRPGWYYRVDADARRAEHRGKWVQVTGTKIVQRRRVWVCRDVATNRALYQTYIDGRSGTPTVPPTTSDADELLAMPGRLLGLSEQLHELTLKHVSGRRPRRR